MNTNKWFLILRDANNSFLKEHPNRYGEVAQRAAHEILAYRLCMELGL